LYDQNIFNYHSVHMCYSPVHLVLLNSHFEAYEDYVILFTLLLLLLLRNTSNKLHIIVATLTSEADGFCVLALLMSRIKWKYEDVI